MMKADKLKELELL